MFLATGKLQRKLCDSVVMESMEVTCTVCEYQYCDDNPPRNLQCGHSFCTSCVHRVLADGGKCPECDAQILARTPKDLPVSYTILRLARAYKELQEKQQKGGSPSQDDSEKQQKGGSPSLDDSVSELDVRKCTKHESRLSFRCQTCEVWVCNDCAVVDHVGPPQGHCRIVHKKEVLTEAKEIFKKTVAAEGRTISLLKYELDRSLSHISKQQEEHIVKLDNIKKQLEYLKLKYEETTNLVKKIDSYIESLHTLGDSVATASTPQDFITATQAATTYSDSLPEVALKIKNILKEFPPGTSSGISEGFVTFVNGGILKSILVSDTFRSMYTSTGTSASGSQSNTSAPPRPPSSASDSISGFLFSTPAPPRLPSSTSDSTSGFLFSAPAPPRPPSSTSDSTSGFLFSAPAPPRPSPSASDSTSGFSFHTPTPPSPFSSTSDSTSGFSFSTPAAPGPPSSTSHSTSGFSFSTPTPLGPPSRDSHSATCPGFNFKISSDSTATSTKESDTTKLTYRFGNLDLGSGTKYFTFPGKDV